MVKTLVCSTLLAALALAPDARAQAPFGGSADVEYSRKLWRAMERNGLVGSNAVMSQPYQGQHPHGAVLDTIDTELKVGRNRGEAIIKRNYGGEGVSITNVANDPDEYLQAVTVMYRRHGYDPENQDWFWVKYEPDGSLHVNPKGMKLAGQVAKGAGPKGEHAGCIACHVAAPGGDMVWKNDRFAEN